MHVTPELNFSPRVPVFELPTPSAYYPQDDPHSEHVFDPFLYTVGSSRILELKEHRDIPSFPSGTKR